MKEHPIIFSSEMVRAILDGRKTQTRRIIKPQPFRDEGEKQWVYRYPSRKKECLHFPDATAALKDLCPYGQVGDRLWVREGYFVASGFYRNGNPLLQGRYSADDETKFSCDVTKDEWGLWKKRKFPYRRTPGRFMYKSLARIFLEITNIRVERVQDTIHKDMRAEGVDGIYCGPGLQDYSYEKPFIELWDSLNAKRGYGWDKNCWVWVIEFKKL